MEKNTHAKCNSSPMGLETGPETGLLS